MNLKSKFLLTLIFLFIGQLQGYDFSNETKHDIFIYQKDGTYFNLKAGKKCKSIDLFYDKGGKIYVKIEKSAFEIELFHENETINFDQLNKNTLFVFTEKDCKLIIKGYLELPSYEIATNVSIEVGPSKIVIEVVYGECKLRVLINDECSKLKMLGISLSTVAVLGFGYWTYNKYLEKNKDLKK